MEETDGDGEGDYGCEIEGQNSAADEEEEDAVTAARDAKR